MNTPDNSNENKEPLGFEKIAPEKRVRSPVDSDEMELMTVPKTPTEISPQLPVIDKNYNPLPFVDKNKPGPAAPWDKQPYADLAPLESEVSVNENPEVEEDIVADTDTTPETEESEKRIALDKLKEAFLAKAEKRSENLKKYVELCIKGVDTVVQKFASTLSERSWHNANPSRQRNSNPEELDAMSTVDKLKYIAEGDYKMGHSPVFMSEDATEIELIPFSRDAAKTGMDFSHEEFDSFQSEVLAELGFFKPGETESSIYTLVDTKNDGSRGIYDKGMRSLLTKLPNELSLRLDFSRDWFRIYVSAEILAAEIDKVKVEDREKMPA